MIAGWALFWGHIEQVPACKAYYTSIQKPPPASVLGLLPGVQVWFLNGRPLNFSAHALALLRVKMGTTLSIQSVTAKLHSVGGSDFFAAKGVRNRPQLALCAKTPPIGCQISRLLVAGILEILIVCVCVLFPNGQPRLIAGQPVGFLAAGLPGVFAAALQQSGNALSDHFSQLAATNLDCKFRPDLEEVKMNRF